MNGRGGGRLQLANSARTGPAIRAVLVVRLEVDEYAVAHLPRRWRGESLPAGTRARVDAGPARYYLDHWGEIGTLVRDCATVEVAGTEPEGVADVRAALLRALSAGVPSAC